MADWIPWDEFEEKYVRLFPSDTGNVAKFLRTALRAMIIQIRFRYSDRELVDQIAGGPASTILYRVFRKNLRMMQAHWFCSTNIFLQTLSIEVLGEYINIRYLRGCNERIHLT